MTHDLFQMKQNKGTSANGNQQNYHRYQKHNNDHYCPPTVDYGLYFCSAKHFVFSKFQIKTSLHQNLLHCIYHQNLSFRN